MNSPKKLLYLIDGTAFAYRAHYSRFTLTNSRAERTDAVYGFVKRLNQIVRLRKPDYLAVVFDAKGKTFRDDMYPKYKANRKPMPDELVFQHPIIEQLVTDMGIKSISIPGVEADDVIGTLAVAADRNGWNTVIASNDKDLAQLVNDSITLRDEHQELDFGPQQVFDKFGVLPNQIVDFFSLVGDSVDNIPGVRLVGKKTAAKWLSNFGSLEELLRNASDIKGKAGENLRNSLDEIKMWHTLVTLKLDVDVGFGLEDLQMSAPNKNALKKIYTRLEFNSFLNELDQSDEQTKDLAPKYHTVNTEKSFSNLIKRMSRAKRFAVDTETTGFDMYVDTLVGISISIEAKEGFYIPLDHNYPNVTQQLDIDLVLSELKPLLENPNIGKILQNSKFDTKVFAKHNIEIKGPIFDTMIESYVVDSAALPKHSLDQIALKYLEHETTKFEDVAGKGKKQIKFDRVDIKTATHYAAENTDITLRIHEVLWPRIESTRSARKVFDEIEMPLVTVLNRMENYGVLIDGDNLKRQSSDLLSRIQSLEEKIYLESGARFNLASPKQIRGVLYDKLNLPSTHKTSSGAPSTSEIALRDLAKNYSVPKMILEYRHLAKLKSTYTDKLSERIHSKTGRLHTSYNQTVANTGRLSSTDPNLQNIPIRTPEGQRIREAFIAQSGHILVSIDYSQIELRLMAHVSEDDRLVEAFALGDDIHRFTAAEVFDTAPNKVTPNQRRNAKAINFGLMYGMSAFGLARQLDIEVAQAREYVKQYFSRYPGVERFMKRTKSWAAEKRYVETIKGRRLYLPDIDSKIFRLRQHAERTAINAPLQGSAADIIKLAMIEVDHWLTQSDCDAKMILQVHDELVFEVPLDQQQQLVKNVKSLMENVAELRVPLIANVGVGANWASAH